MSAGTVFDFGVRASKLLLHSEGDQLLLHQDATEITCLPPSSSNCPLCTGGGLVVRQGSLSNLHDLPHRGPHYADRPQTRTWSSYDVCVLVTQIASSIFKG
ncbi:hypothetical protein QOT17_016627 [Balamuthia mandrillaris]